VRHTLFLRDDGTVLADAFIVNLGPWFLVLVEGPDETEMVAWLEMLKTRSPEKKVLIAGLGAEWAIFGVDGPYSWEVAAGLLGPGVLGMPYLTLLQREDLFCIRAGKTGEYGYLLIVPQSAAVDVESKLTEIGHALDLMTVTRDALDVCALESWQFTMRAAGTAPLTPIELQLQWRVVYSREFVGSVALRGVRASGAKGRATCFTSDEPVAAGQRIRLGSLDIGEVLAVVASPTLGQTVGSALISLSFAHPHLALSAMTEGRLVPIRTCTASLIHNVSLGVRPNEHSYATRESRS